MKTLNLKESYELTTDLIISNIPSERMRKYLLDNKNKITIMQYATIAENYCKENIIAVLDALKNFSDNEYEKSLFTIAMKDYKKYNHIGRKTIDFYLKNDPRDKKPMCPFEEFIFLPTVFREYDLALLLEKDSKIVVTGRTIKFDENDDENANYDFSDLSYMVYDLDTPFEITEENLVNIHIHAHYCDLERIEEVNLTDKQKNKYDKLVEILKNVIYEY